MLKEGVKITFNGAEFNRDFTVEKVHKEKIILKDFSGTNYEILIREVPEAIE